MHLIKISITLILTIFISIVIHQLFNQKLEVRIDKEVLIDEDQLLITLPYEELWLLSKKTLYFNNMQYSFEILDTTEPFEVNNTFYQTVNLQLSEPFRSENDIETIKLFQEKKTLLEMISNNIWRNK